MTLRNPLVRISGTIQELPAGDTIGGAAPGQQGVPGAMMNYIRNGGMLVAQRPAAAISTSFQYGKVDAWKVSMAPAGSGTITQDTAAPLGRTGYALEVSNFTTDPSGSIINLLTHIESKDAVLLKNAVVSLSILVYHDSGVNVAASLGVNKATVQDNFTSVTSIGSSGILAPASGVATLLKLEGVSMGDCSNGIQVTLALSFLPCTSKNLWVAEAVLSEGTTAPAFPYRSFEDEIAHAVRYFWKTFTYTVAPAQNVGFGGAIAFMPVVAGAVAGQYRVQNPTPMRSATPAFTFYNPAAANALPRNFTRTNDAASVTAGNESDLGCELVITGVSGWAVGDRCFLHLTVDADF